MEECEAGFAIYAKINFSLAKATGGLTSTVEAGSPGGWKVEGDGS